MLAIEDPNLEDWIPQLATNLTHTEHLDHAHNLSRWTITHLDNHHHLVETTNHTGWHLPTPPWIDPNVMAQALDDFGDIILPAPPPPDFPS